MNLRATPSPSKTVDSALEAILGAIQPLCLQDEIKKVIDPNHSPKEKDYIWFLVKKINEVAQFSGYQLAYQNSLIYVFNQKFWQQVEPDIFKFFLSRAAIRLGHPAHKAEHHRTQDDLLRQFFTSKPLAQPTPEKGKAQINLQNGTLEIIKEQVRLKKFHSRDFLRYQLPFEYDESATCPEFKEFLNTVLPDEQAQLVLQEYIGYLFARDLKLEKVMFLYGSGSNGKSTFQEILTAMLGRENVCNMTLGELNRENYRLQLSDKIINYSSETGSNIDGHTFKKLASGEPITARQLYGKPVELDDYARFVFNTNELPKKLEANEAFYRRLLIIPFTTRIKDDDKDIHLSRRIIDNELSGILNWTLEGLKRIYRQQKFSESPAIQGLMKEYRESGDEIDFFLEDRGYSPGIEDHISLNALFDEYQHFCRSENIRPKGKMTLSKELEKREFEKSRNSRGIIFRIGFLN